jgi:SAM-dependent methyltransferase
VKGQPRSFESPEPRPWPGWCCSYCWAPLEERAHGLYCASEERWFATDRGVHRLLPEDRRREILPFLELYQRVRRDEGWKAEPGLPDVPPGHPHAAVWRQRAARFLRGLDLAAGALGRDPWRVLEVGAGCCWASARLVERGQRVGAVDVNLDRDDGLAAADQLVDEPWRLPRAEAEMEALPLEAGVFDMVLAAGALHYAPRLTRTLVELRRVTRRGGILLVLDSPVYRRRPDGEAMVADRMKAYRDRYGVAVPRESQSGYLVLGELADDFRNAGWKLEVHDWPGVVRERLRDAGEIARHGRRVERYPILLARRDG